MATSLKDKTSIELNGKLLKYMRITRNKTQHQLANMLFVAPCTLSHYELGSREVPNAVLAEAAKKLDFDFKLVDCLSEKEVTRIQVERITKN